MNEDSFNEELARLVRVINWPGEGLVVEIQSDQGSRMFTLEGLQWQIMAREKRGERASLELTALSMLSAALETTHGNANEAARRRTDRTINGATHDRSVED